MKDIVRTESCHAPVEVAFDYVADYRNISDWLFGVEKFEPVGDQGYGKGSLFDVTVHLGVRLHTRIRAVEWEEQRLIGMESVQGVKVRSRFSFEPDGPDRTTVTAKVSYDLPFGPAGAAMGMFMEPFVKQAIAHASHKLVENIERLPQG